MTDSTTGATGAPARQAHANALYFAVWRWHFYAGIYVIPFLIILSISGILMVWFTAIAPEYGDRISVKPMGQPLSLLAQQEMARMAYPAGEIGKYVAPYDAETPALFQVNLDGGNRILAIDPYSGAVLRDRAQDGTWNDWANALHGELLLGRYGGWGDLLVEIAASLGLMLVVTGLYLAWPRSGRGLRHLFLPDLAARGRAFWKSLHLATGVWTSLLLVWFLISGLAWAGIWGGKFVQAWSSFPAAKWDDVPLSDTNHASMNHGAMNEVPWGLEQVSMPESGKAAGHTGIPIGVAVDLGSVAQLARDLGFAGRFQLAAPRGAAGVWTISQDTTSYDSPDPTADRTVHVDQYSGKILADVKFQDYGLMAKTMAIGVALHEGQMGLWNAVLNIAFCGLVILACLSGVVMWWIRRPAGAARLAAPPRPEVIPLTKGILGIAALMALAFPVLGVTLGTVLALDFLVISRFPALKQALS